MFLQKWASARGSLAQPRLPLETQLCVTLRSQYSGAALGWGVRHSLIHHQTRFHANISSSISAEQINILLNKKYVHSSFTNRCTFIKTLIKICIEVMWLIHVSVYDHYQGACNSAWLKLLVY